MAKIICVGSMNIDIAAYVTTLPRPGETVFGSSLASSPGGKGLNQAVAARRLGADVAFIGQLGADTNGDTVLAFLNSEGIDTSGIVRHLDVQSGAAIILVDAASENAIAVIPGANMAWPPNAVSELTLSRTDIVISQFEVPDGVIIDVFRRAQVAGAMTVLNAAPARSLPPGLLELVDVLVVNEGELAAVSGQDIDPSDIDAITAAAKKLAAPQRSIVTTLGRGGAIVVDTNAVTRIPGVTVSAVDTAGAGDCFIGALVSALLRGQTLETASAFANRAAAVSVTRRGTAIAMPRLDEI